MLKDSIHNNVEEQVAMFLHVVARGGACRASPVRCALRHGTLLAQRNGVGGGEGRRCCSWLGPSDDAPRKWPPKGLEEGAPLLQGSEEGADAFEF